VCDLETSRIGAPYIYDISNIRVKCELFLLHSYIPLSVLQQVRSLFQNEFSTEWGLFLPLSIDRLPVTSVFPSTYLSFNNVVLSFYVNLLLKLAKTGHGPHSSTLVCICVLRLLFVLFYVLFVCKCVLPSGDNPTAVNKYIKIIFNSEHFNYNVHFLNIMSVRWRPLSTHSPKRFWKFCITCCSRLGEIAATSSLMF